MKSFAAIAALDEAIAHLHAAARILAVNAAADELSPVREYAQEALKAASDALKDEMEGIEYGCQVIGTEDSKF